MRQGRSEWAIIVTCDFRFSPHCLGEKKYSAITSPEAQEVVTAHGWIRIPMEDGDRLDMCPACQKEGES